MKIVKNTNKLRWLLPAIICFSTPVFAAGPSQPTALENPLAQVLILLMVLLAVAIGILTNVVNSAASIFREKMRAEKETLKKDNQPVITALLIIGAMLLSITGMTQAKTDAVLPVADTSINGLSTVTFYAMISVLAVEIIIIIALVYMLKWLVGIERKAAVVAASEIIAVPVSIKINKWWNKVNKSISIDKEKDIDLNHDYDGIRELDNSIPPWWMLGFVFFIVFGVGYLYRYHVAKSAPLQIEELKIAMQQADDDKQAYLKLTANNIDENSVKKLDETGVAAGKALFVQNCVACHGADGQGVVGPNLTDNYWIHGGDIKDVFKTIKYGWPDKGMRSWQEDFSPKQIAELASFVKTLAGTKPVNPKEPQGELYNEKDDAPKADSAASNTQASLK